MSGTAGGQPTGQAPAEQRVVFDFEVVFSNGGGLQGQEFRLDLHPEDMRGDDIDEDALAAYIVRDLRLLMVERVAILSKRIVGEAHRRPSRG
jgi:arylformamidase